MKSRLKGKVLRIWPEYDGPNSNFFLPNLEFVHSSTFSGNSWLVLVENGKSSAPNSIPIKLLKIIDLPISNDLAVLINKSCFTGTFPAKLKIAKVIPIIRKGYATSKSNYRPISPLSVFSKLFEKFMHQRLSHFLDVCEVLFCMQFGFHTGHSTDHALISSTESIKSSSDKNRFACGIFLQRPLIQSTVICSLKS